MSILKAKDLVVGYEDKEVVQGVNFEVNQGDVLCLLGANGSGKTTILRTLAGLLKPLRGTVLLKNENLYQMPENRVAKQLAVVLTERRSMGLLTAFEVVAMGRYVHTDFFGRLKSKDIKIVTEALEMVNALSLADRYIHQLSDGEKQKIFLARALAQEPELIIMDEPTSFLDIRHKVELVSIINKLSKERDITIIASLHEVGLAVRCSDMLMLVKDGGILDYGRPDKIMNPSKIKLLYGIDDNQYEQILGSFDQQKGSGNLVFGI